VDRRREHDAPLTRLKTTWDLYMSLWKSLGPVQYVNLVEHKQEGEQRLYRYRIAYEQGTRLALVTLGKENKISNLTTEEE
jgi:hypothetical protein